MFSVPAPDMTNNSALSFATVALDGGLKISARGFVLNTTGMPTLSDTVLSTGTGVGEIQGLLEGL